MRSLAIAARRPRWACRAGQPQIRQLTDVLHCKLQQSGVHSRTGRTAIGRAGCRWHPWWPSWLAQDRYYRTSAAGLASLAQAFPADVPSRPAFFLDSRAGQFTGEAKASRGVVTRQGWWAVAPRVPAVPCPGAAWQWRLRVPLPGGAAWQRMATHGNGSCATGNYRRGGCRRRARQLQGVPWQAPRSTTRPNSPRRAWPGWRAAWVMPMATAWRSRATRVAT